LQQITVALLLFSYSFTEKRKWKTFGPTFFSAGEMLTAAEPFLQQQLHPTVIISAFRQALEDIINIVKDDVSSPVNASSKEEMLKIINTCLGTKMLGNWSGTFSLCGKFLSNIA
jgi:chaperonin GroEL (HSP60 family)